MAKLFLLCKRVRPDILTGVAYFTTRVREPDEDNDKKLLQIIKYPSGMRDLVLALESDGTVTMKW